MSKDESNNCIGRRGFLKSIFGLSSTAIEQPSGAKELPRQEPSFFWCDLKTGFIGFPSGLNLPRVMPGSLMKIVAAAALNEQHLINPNETFDCHGHFAVHKETFHCQFPHGPVDLVKAIAFSCNCFFARASERLPAKLFLEYARKFGLADPVAKIPSGPFPTETTDASLTFVLGLNPAMQPNAIQIMRMSALVARKGEIPYLHSADDMSLEKPFTAALSESTWNRLQLGMQLASREGTAKKLDPENKLHIACKTGTSMHGKKFQSWVTGYFPYDAPKHAFCLCAPAGTSQEAAVPQAHAKLFETEWP